MLLQECEVEWGAMVEGRPGRTSRSRWQLMVKTVPQYWHLSFLQRLQVTAPPWIDPRPTHPGVILMAKTVPQYWHFSFLQRLQVTHPPWGDAPLLPQPA